MNLEDFDYELPAGSIAQRPLAERDASRMLLLNRATGAWQDRRFRELPTLLRGNELLVLNDARVLPARLFGNRAGLRAEPPSAKSPVRAEFLTSPIEVLLVRHLAQDTWEALVRPGRKIPVGERIVFGEGELEARVQARAEYGLRVLRFESKNGFHEALERLGHIPLPPYIKRTDEPLDRERYQTVYAQQGSAVAAPTAGLHFTPAILESLRERGVEIAKVTLDVGLGTFEPIRTESLEKHKIHVESYGRSVARSENIVLFSRSGPQSCVRWKTPLKKRLAATHFCARVSLMQASSYFRASRSALSINCSRISIFRDRACSHWSPVSQGSKTHWRPTAMRSLRAIAFTVTAIVC
jgi:S-adenosylmethionine:tRNA ribosyltransferase-isomerase